MNYVSFPLLGIWPKTWKVNGAGTLPNGSNRHMKYGLLAFGWTPYEGWVGNSIIKITKIKLWFIVITSILEFYSVIHIATYIYVYE